MGDGEVCEAEEGVGEGDISRVGDHVIFCLKCGSNKVHRFVSSDCCESRCKECGLRVVIDLDGWECDMYKFRSKNDWVEVPRWCLIVLSWDREEE
jgi:hypothetical protein